MVRGAVHRVPPHPRDLIIILVLLFISSVRTAPCRDVRLPHRRLAQGQLCQSPNFHLLSKCGRLGGDGSTPCLDGTSPSARAVPRSSASFERQPTRAILGS